jgi:hypothetical protein
MAQAQRFDDIFLLVVQELQTPEALLTEFFNFLARRTNFYDKDASDLVQTTYQEHRELYLRAKFEGPLLPAFKLTFGPEQLNILAPALDEPVEEPQVFLTENGGKSELYEWAQSEADLRLKVSVPHGTKAKDLSVRVETQRLELSLRGSGPLLQGELFSRIKPGESFWLLEENSVLFTLCKATAGLWQSALKGD